MCKHWVLFSLVGVSILARGYAQENPRFRFQPGEVLQYRVQQTTKVMHTLAGETSVLESSTELVKRWEIQEVGADGTVVMQLTIPQIKLTQKLPTGQSVHYDSTKPDDSHPALKQQMEQFLGKPTVRLKIDARGNVLQAQPLVTVSVGHFASEPPFAVVLPPEPWKTQLRWTRPYSLVLEPPLGTGDEYQAEQQLELRALNERQAEITWVTHVKGAPTTATERIPLLQKLTRGVAVFDLTTHRVTLIRMQAGGAVEGHEGPNSKYEFVSEYIERLLP
ncbi:hypothetical protein HRbin36_01484 [bacterium HR36]|nr:hypothetical protein HRbin36_01484 [bacterium HR36]